jgi:hypothetical protein
MFAKGATPYFSFDNENWQSVNNAEYFSTSYPPTEDPRPVNCRPLNTLKFTFNFQADKPVYFAYCPPYTFAKLQSYLSSLLVSKAIRSESLCTSLTGLSVPLIRLDPLSMDSSKYSAETDRRPAFFIIARVHPGETCGSHMMHGVMRELTGDSYYSRSLRDAFEFILIPMFNPDGVVLGNFRTDLVGDDLNRQYIHPSVKFHPSIVAFIRLFQEMKHKKRVAGLLDLHGHSTKPGVFSYGPQISTSDSFSNYTHIFPYFVSLRTPMFKFDKCTYKLTKHKLSTARAYFLKKGRLRIIRGEVCLHCGS